MLCLRLGLPVWSGPILPSHKIINTSVLVRLAGLIAATLLAVGCATAPPVQEMSNARQAIAAAVEASADVLAPEVLEDARRFLETAEEQLRNEYYGAARLNAVRARNRALQALEQSQEAESRSE